MIEELKIQELLKKYENYFETSVADVSKSIKGKRFFYFVDSKSGELYSFIEFNTAKELEQIILH